MRHLQHIFRHFPARLFLVGGAVRDHLSGKAPKDYDLASSLSPDEVSRWARGNRFTVIPVGVKHGTVILRIEGEEFEHTTFRTREGGIGDSIVDDLSARDFTMNAIAMELRSGKIVDPYHGADDLAAGVIRAVGHPVERFLADPLRVFRAARFAATLGMRIELFTWAAMRGIGPEAADSLSAERIRDEFFKAFSATTPSRFLRILYEIGAIQHARVLPEFADSHKLGQHPKYHPEGSVWEHTLAVVDAAPPSHRWDALLHDIGKPGTAVAVPNEAWFRYPKHAEHGATLIPAIAQRLRLPRILAKRIEEVTRLHMLPLSLSTKKDPAEGSTPFPSVSRPIPRRCPDHQYR